MLSSGQLLFVPVTVVVALERVLPGAYCMVSADIAAVLEDLLAVEGLTVDRAAAVAQALQACRAGLDLVDALHLAQSGLCSGLATFGARFVKAALLPLTCPAAWT